MMKSILEIAQKSLGTGLEQATDEIWSSRVVLSVEGDRASEAGIKGMIEDYCLMSGFSTADVAYLTSLRRDDLVDDYAVTVILYGEETHVMKSNIGKLSTVPMAYGAYLN